MIPMTDQWKRTGNCELCRRKSYCKKPCKAKKNRRDSMIRDAVEKAMSKVVSAYMGRALDKEVWRNLL